MSQIYSTVDPKHFNPFSNEGLILNFLESNKEHWIGSKELAKLINAEHENTYASVRYCVAVLRDNGEPIVSGVHGFMFTENKDELWAQAIAGQLSVGQQVRVKSDVFQGEQGTKFNGRRGNIVAIRTGRIVVKSTDGLTPELDGEHFRAEQLELRIK